MPIVEREYGYTVFVDVIFPVCIYVKYKANFLFYTSVGR